ncbi:MAG: Nif3-like dinuclear metal center hexameric protein [Clostridia bacterium]|nr:Nif3-like dinuclear metal center hexameric protein [Clostridia bacterium]
MIRVKEIFDFLCERYPLQTACDFDNAGFLVGDRESKIKKALVCLDCDITAVNKAKELGCNLIITHHPVIFGGLKSITEESVVYKLIKEDISVISMHTNLDIAADGVTVRLCEALGLKNIKPFIALDGFALRSATADNLTPEDFAALIKEKLSFSVRFVKGSRNINKVLLCSGSGGEFLRDAIDNGFDALVTADVKHNVFIDAVNSDISVFDGGHYATENIIVKPLAKLLQNEFSDIEFIPYSPDLIKSI